MHFLGYYAAGITEKGHYYDNYRKETKSELIGLVTENHQKSCLTFYYMLNGDGIKSKGAISMYIKDPKGSYRNFVQSFSGHQGKVWKKAVYNTGKLTAGSKVSSNIL